MRRAAAMVIALVALASVALWLRDDDRLRLSFERVADLPYPLVTGIEFFPSGSGEFLIVDRDGGFAHMNLDGDEVEVRMRGRIEGLYVERAGATGILGLALDPDFDANHFFFVAVTLARDRVAVLRYTLHEDAAKTAASRVTILDFKAQDAPRWHNLMALGFEPSGLMWVMIGDKGLFEPAQDPGTVLGSLLRFVPSREEGKGGYTVPSGTPMYFPGAHPGVFAIGIRSPWHAVYHEGRWFFGDVGDRVEEFNLIDRPGLNFGWPSVEGPCELDSEWSGDCEAFTDPWDWYDRSSSHAFVKDDREAVPTSSRSGYVGWIYRPSERDRYEGRFDDVIVFGDTYVGFVRGKRIDADDPSWHVGHLQWASAWAQGPDGYVYVTTLGEWPPQKDETARPPSGLYRAALDS